MSLLLGFVIGVVVGWHVPQPSWAEFFIDKVKEKFNK